MNVNKLLEMQKALKERRNQLEKLTVENSKAAHWLEVPKYNPTALDKMVTDINNALFEISATIKESNAITKVEVAVDFSDLMRPIQ